MGKKHYTHSHSTSTNIYKAAERVKRDLERETEAAVTDNWYMSLAVCGLVYREATGNNQKTEKFLSRVAEYMQYVRNNAIPTAELVAELERVTGISLEVQDG